MTTTMCNKELLVGYLYDDLPPADRAAVQAHLVACPDCREEVAQLGGVRQLLTAWSPPEPPLEFQVVRGVPPAVRRPSWLPAWGLAAAASVLLLAGAAAIANLELRYGPDGFVIRTGWGAPVPASAPSASPARADAAAAPVPEEPGGSDRIAGQLTAFERRLSDLEQARPEAVRPAAAFTPEQLATVRKLLAESERRQQAERAQLVSQVWNDFNAARTSDYVRMHEALGRVQGLTNYQLKQHKESIDSLYRVSLQR